MREGWLIWSNEWASWWRPSQSGYTREITKAGRYSFEAAVEICALAAPRAHTAFVNERDRVGIPPEVMVPSPELIVEIGKAQHRGGK